MEKKEAVELLEASKEKLELVETKSETLQILAFVGKQIGFKPAFRCLVNGVDPDQSVKW